MYHIFFIHPSIYRHLVCVHVLLIVNRAAMNIGAPVSFWIMIFSGYTCGLTLNQWCVIARSQLTSNWSPKSWNLKNTFSLKNVILSYLPLCWLPLICPSWQSWRCSCPMLSVDTTVSPPRGLCRASAVPLAQTWTQHQTPAWTRVARHQHHPDNDNSTF